MATPYIGQISMVGFNFPPKGWALCNGQTLPISQNQALFAILGTTYGGNGTTTFKLPNLQGATPIHVGPGFVLGATDGEVSHTLTTNELPSHTHVPAGSAASGAATPVNNFWGGFASGTVFPYGSPADTTLEPQAIGSNGSSQPHNNLQPYLVVNFIIALVGIFPSRN